LVSFVAVTAGCRKGDSPKPSGEPADSLPTHEASAGGTLAEVPAGAFNLGDSGGRADEEPHRLSGRSFRRGTPPVTEGRAEHVTGGNPSKRKEAKNPVERTQWTDAVRFCNKCSELEGLSPCYNLDTWACNFAADGYRLPTEAEWEYACRAGGTGKYCFGDDEN